MALVGKELGTDMGQLFGPNAAATTTRSFSSFLNVLFAHNSYTPRKTLTTAFPEFGLSVAVAVDSTRYQNQVIAASYGETTSRSPRRQHGTTWGDTPVCCFGDRAWD
ncbi:hypothetical protein CPC08DRAFT_766849 [Agrocybe pediades]|nr:hypothetical protein CPC08DRAFT_766849 [Agrocybe pediades]